METVISILEIIGIISFSAAGAMVAIEKEADLFGVLFLSLITCFGGGILRDILVGEAIGRPIPWVLSGSDDANFYLIIALAASAFVFLVAMLFKKQYVREEGSVVAINNILDAIGIGVFAAMGTASCVDMGPLVAITMGMVSAVFGGLTRDIILRDIPFILRKYVYAVATIIGSALYYLIVKVVMPGNEAAEAVGAICCTLTVFAIRILATAFRLNLPKAIRFSQINSENEEKRDLSLK
ncbi:MAG: TRIC cation channel family protein [Clostridia bacterium]|nr:TRIC cation channel family protein [Clostridia bacterium]